MTDVKPGEVAERLEARARLADRRKAGAEFNGMPFMATEEVEIAKELRIAASLIRALNERVERLEGALGDLLLRLENKIALARDSNATSYGHSYVLCAGIEACIEASKSRAALERK